jgi:hypothetical protein
MVTWRRSRENHAVWTNVQLPIAPACRVAGTWSPAGVRESIIDGRRIAI